MQKEETKFLPSDRLEGMTSISAVLNAGEENDRRILRVLVDRTREASKARELGFLRARAKTDGFSVELTAPEEIAALALGNTHGGILAECSARTLPALTSAHIRPDAFYVYLEGVEDPYNFGYAVRSLYAAGVAGVVLPPRNWMSAAGVVARASAGCSERLPIYTADPETAVETFRTAGYRILCAGIRDSVSVFDADLCCPVLLVIGGEKRGISRALLDRADTVLRIDYGREFKGSLSAASAATVLAFEILRANRK